MDFEKLRTAFKGLLITPADSEYDKARRVFYGGFDKKPALIVRARDTDDIRKAISLAKRENLELAVRSGGHSVAGYGTTDGGIVIDMQDMKKLEINDAEKTAWAETGLTAMEVTNELDKHNFVLGFGDTGSVGIGGITLGGGIGFLVRKFGMAIDNLLAAEIVTADGQVYMIDDANHPDLFWAIRGGGGNFGVVTKFKYNLHDLGDCYGGMLILPATPEVILGVVDIATEAPDELSTIANIMPVMPMPMIPEKYHGKPGVMVLMVYAGNPDDGEKIIAPIKALAKPYVDMTKQMRYKDIFFPEDPNYHPTAVSRNMRMKTVDLKLANDIIDWLNKIDAPMRALQLRVLGGKMAKVPDDATAYGHRKSPIMANIASFYETEKEKEERQKWANDFAEVLYQGDDGAYIGFLGTDEEKRLSYVYPPETLRKLKAVKKKYDPGNFFRLNYNISP